ncbi:MAG: hypothetical protein RLZZ399_1914 [Verrucomicrobiota bacterium]|jgi:hypothetical protein
MDCFTEVCEPVIPVNNLPAFASNRPITPQRRKLFGLPESYSQVIRTSFPNRQDSSNLRSEVRFPHAKVQSLPGCLNLRILLALA